MKSFIAKRVISILVNLGYLRFLKLLKYKENNKKICNTFDHKFKNIPLYIYIYIMKKVLLERHYIVLYDGALTLKLSKMALNPFCSKTLQMPLTAGIQGPLKGPGNSRGFLCSLVISEPYFLSILIQNMREKQT